MIPLRNCCQYVDGTNAVNNFGPFAPGQFVRGVWLHLYQGAIGTNYASFAISMNRTRCTTTAQMREGDVLVGPDPTNNSTLPRIGTVLLTVGPGVTCYIPLNVRAPADRPWLAVHVTSGDAAYGYAAVDADQAPEEPGAPEVE